MKTNELTGAALDYWVAKCEGLNAPRIYKTSAGVEVCEYLAPGDNGFEAMYLDFQPSTDWADCGPLIERYGIHLCLASGGWEANCDLNQDLTLYAKARTAQQALCRAVVLAAFGKDIHGSPAIADDK